MKKAGDSCEFAKQLLPILFVLFVVMLTGVKLFKAEEKTTSYSEQLEIIAFGGEAFGIPTKIVDESGNVISSSTGFVKNTSESKKNTELNENAKQVINDVFNGTYILNMMKNSDLDEEKKNIIYSIFGEKNPEISEDSSEQVVEEENIIIDSIITSGEELIDVEQVVEEPVQEEKTPLAPGRESVWLYEESQVPDNYITYYDMSATAYCLCKKCTGKTPGSSGYGRTSSGLVIVPGTSMKVCAVNKKQIPLGTHIYVQGLNGAKDYGYAIAADTGGAITTNRIDLYFDNHSTCLQWGRRSVRVYILPEE